MIRSFVGRLGFLLLLLASAPHEDAAAESPSPIAKDITWVLNDFPPFIQVDGPLPGNGFVDAAVRYIAERMPDYNHRFEVSGIARAVGLMQQGTPVCHPALLPTAERMAYAVASRPVHFTLPHYVIARADRAERLRPFLDRDGRISLDSLLGAADITTSFTEQRAFAPAIQTALAAHKGAPNILFAGVHFNAPFLQMAAGWVDYIIAYPVEPRWYNAKGQALNEQPLVYYPIAGVEDYTLGHVMCTKGPWGEAVVQRVNAIVVDAGARPPWIDTEIALSDEASGRRLDELFTRYNPFRR
ncbi:hypothetical protein [Azospirillum sp.]|uniref:hypothetical protein n=1 Tax=Azospirillum sp. TaxID=34012 RepID=UPI00261D7307|nr:hypothetical protein [Azospirillum sp.]